MDLEHSALPFFYLIGPVLGGGDWQAEMCRLLFQHLGPCIIAVPCRWKNAHPLHAYFVSAQDTYERQLEWEQKYIQEALTRKQSCAICWLPCESKTAPRNDGNPYGRDTLGEMGYFRGLLRYNRDLPIVVGGDPDFHAASVMMRNFDYTYKRPFPFATSMKEVVTAAIARVCR